MNSKSASCAAVSFGNGEISELARVADSTSHFVLSDVREVGREIHWAIGELGHCFLKTVCNRRRFGTWFPLEKLGDGRLRGVVGGAFGRRYGGGNELRHCRKMSVGVLRGLQGAMPMDLGRVST